MRLKPETIAAHQARHARERRPRQLDLPLEPHPRRLADTCPRCHCVHSGAAEAEHCRQANMQREQY